MQIRAKFFFATFMTQTWLNHVENLACSFFELRPQRSLEGMHTTLDLQVTPMPYHGQLACLIQILICWIVFLFYYCGHLQKYTPLKITSAF